jgi:hypothetical protein
MKNITKKTVKTVRVNEVGFTPLLEGPATITKLTVKGGRAQGMSLYVGADLHSVFAIIAPSFKIEMFNDTAYKFEVQAGLGLSLKLDSPAALVVEVETEGRK